jgi:methionyl-tRNA synthetase
MPETAAAIQKHLGFELPENTEPAFYDLGTISAWGMIKPGTSMPKAVSLFPRLDPEAILSRAEPQKALEKKKKKQDLAPEIGLDEFAKVDLRAATILSAEKVVKADKLLKLEIDLGDEKRTVVAGLSKFYTPEELTGKTVIVVANLKPAKLLGIRSEGMVLAAVEDKDGAVAVLDRPMPAGTRLK